MTRRWRAVAAMLAAALLALVLFHVRLPRFEASAVALSGVGASTGVPAVSFRFDVNHATAEELCQLRGVGPAIAQAIVRERERGGDYFYPEDLKAAKGIGDKKLAGMREQLVGP